MEPDTKKTQPFTHKFPFDGEIYYAKIKAGDPLTWCDKTGWLVSTWAWPVPKKVLKKALKAWRALNPPKDGFAMPKLSGPYALVLLKDWLSAKMGTK